MGRTGARAAGGRVVRRPAVALAAVLAVAGPALAGCTWDPHAAQRSASSSGASSEPAAPSASSVSHEVSPSGGASSPAGPSSGSSSAQPSASGSSGASGSSASSSPHASGAPSPFGTSSASPRPATDPDVVGSFDESFPRATGAGTGDEVGTLTDIGVSRQDGFDRVVLELEGPDVPAWEVRYVPRAVGDPHGETVDVDGDAVLQVLLQPVAYPESGTATYGGAPRVSRPGTTAVAEVVVSTFFDGELQAFVGVRDERRPFRVYGMTDPARVVIEVERP